MPFCDFLDREDYYSILNDTLTEYFEQKIIISDKQVKFGKEYRCFYCFPRIGYLVPKNSKKSVKRFIKRSYRITNSKSKRMLMNAYLLCVFCLPKLFKKKYIYIPVDSCSQDMLIEPGNKKVKLYNFSNNVIHNIRKKGFSDEWIKKEIEYRRNHHEEYILPLEEKEYGYDERLLVGYSYPRLTKRERNTLDNCVSQVVNDISKESFTKPTEEYAEELVIEIKAKADDLLETKRCDANDILLLCETSIRIKSLISDGNNINITFSHGDMQRGNLFWETGKDMLYVLDWETWGYRSINYDRLLLWYNFRNSTMLIENIKRVNEDKGSKLEHISVDGNGLRNVLSIFILEDILWQLDECSILPSGTLGNGMRFYLDHNRMDKVFHLLEHTK